MRLALLSDVHGNPIALEAVLADVAAQGGVDGYVVLGDLAALGYDPVGALERLARLPNVRITRGNVDRFVTTGARPGPTIEEAQAHPRLVPQVVATAALFAWTHGAVSATGWLRWLADLPLEVRLTLPDGTRLLGVHASPGSDEVGISPAVSDTDLAKMLAGCEADLVCVGHTHWPLDRTAGGVRVVNLGSVSNPMAPDLRASYVLLEAGPNGYHVEHRRVAYDLGAVLEAIQASGQPAPEFVASFFRGERRPPWEH